MDWTMQGGSPTQSYQVEDALRLPLKLAWKASAGLKEPPWSDTLIVGKRVLVATYTMVSGLDLDTGELLWRAECLPIKLVAENYITSRIAAWGNRLFFSDYYGNLYCVDIHDGRTLWIKEDAGSRGNAICVTEDRIISATNATTTVATRPGFHVLDFDGKVIWAKENARLNTLGVSLYKDWIVYGQRPNQLTAARLFDGQEEQLLNLNQTELLQAMDLVDQPELAYFKGAPSIVGDDLLVNVGVPWRILVFDLLQRQLRWWHYNLRIQGWGMNRDSVYGAGTGGDFHRFDRQTGEEVLRTEHFFPQGHNSSAGERGTTVGDYCFFYYDQREEEQVIAFEIQTGQPVWRYSLLNRLQAPISYADGNLMVCDVRGMVYCFRTIEELDFYADR